MKNTKSDTPKTKTSTKAKTKETKKTKDTGDIKTAPKKINSISIKEKRLSSVGSKINFQDKLSKVKARSRVSFLKKHMIVMVSGVIGIAIVIVVGIGIAIYGFKSESKLVYRISRIINYPVVTIDSKIFPWFSTKSAGYDQYLYYLESTRQGEKTVREKQGNTNEISEEDYLTLKTEILDNLGDRLILDAEAKKRGIEISDEEVQTRYTQLVESSGGEEKASEFIRDYYGWSVAEWQENILRKGLLEEKLAEALSNDQELADQARVKAEEVLAKVEAGEDFAQLAQEYSEDGSAQNGGDLGVIEKGATVQSFEDAAFALDKGETSGIVETEFGFHIIKVMDKSDDGKIRVSHILIKRVDFDSWMEQARIDYDLKFMINFDHSTDSSDNPESNEAQASEATE
ncbi:peptidylprolyl isomerase [Candidatus Saccharibacteria bacterium]|nr:peptidylprolyl isomerase [Candidatus Saccharibacteria bacterium]MCB9834618.1 peptidylprolyl isomerase [Candidatus Nomurabacteria bacterium]